MTQIDLYQQATQHLAGLDKDLAQLISRVGVCKHQTRPAREPYEALIRAVAYQQISVRVGDSMINKLLALSPTNEFLAPTAIAQLSYDQLRACGFSSRKIETIQQIAKGALSGLVPSLAQALEMKDEELIQCLTSIKGIGLWSVEMFLIYSLERADIMPIDDFGIKEGYRFLKSLNEMPTRKELAGFSALCSPYRTVASWYLWRAVELPDYKKLARKTSV